MTHKRLTTKTINIRFDFFSEKSHLNFCYQRRKILRLYGDGTVMSVVTMIVMTVETQDFASLRRWHRNVGRNDDCNDGRDARFCVSTAMAP